MSRAAAWGLLLLLNFAAGVAVVYAKHSSLALFRDLQRERQAYHRLQTDWSRLLLERGALAAYPRVERLAAARLGMRRPELSAIELLRP